MKLSLKYSSGEGLFHHSKIAAVIARIENISSLTDVDKH